MTDRRSSDVGTDGATPLSATDYHVLLVLVESDLYGYAIMQAVERDSRGSVALGIGSLYRVLGRLESEGLLEEAPNPPDAQRGHRGRPRRYYRLTDAGREALRAESLRMRGAVELAVERRLLPEGFG